jgi:glycogen synthase
VRRTGGLGDTVKDVASAPPGEGNGYVFDGTDEGRWVDVLCNHAFFGVGRAASAFQLSPNKSPLPTTRNLNQSSPNRPPTESQPNPNHPPKNSLFSALDRALGDYASDPAAWSELARNNMNAELSWSKPAADYVAIYNAVADLL